MCFSRQDAVLSENQVFVLCVPPQAFAHVSSFWNALLPVFLCPSVSGITTVQASRSLVYSTSKGNREIASENKTYRCHGRIHLQKGAKDDIVKG